MLKDHWHYVHARYQHQHQYQCQYQCLLDSLELGLGRGLFISHLTCILDLRVTASVRVRWVGAVLLVNANRGLTFGERPWSCATLAVTLCESEAPDLKSLSIETQTCAGYSQLSCTSDKGDPISVVRCVSACRMHRAMHV